MLLLTVEGVCIFREFLDWLRRRGTIRATSDPEQQLRLEVLAIGTFYHANWYRAHLSPLADARVVKELRVVSGTAGEPLSGVRWCVGPPWLSGLIGMNLARVLVAARETMIRKPDIIIGYFVFPCALLSLLLARLAGTRAAYQMCGGPLEIVHCGSHSENPLLTRVFPRFPGLERLLFRVVNRFDLIVVRGAVAQAFCQERLSRPIVRVLRAGIDNQRFHPGSGLAKRYDLVAVSRMSRWKQLDIMIQALAQLTGRMPGINAVIVGDGPEMRALQALASRLAVRERIHFVGERDDVEKLLAQARVFVLPSSSEGFSIAMAEAMACGLPAVVSDVGELGELVQAGRNGYLVPVGDVAGFARAIDSLLKDPVELAEFGGRAAEDAYRLCAAPTVSRGWSQVLTQVATGDASVVEARLGPPNAEAGPRTRMAFRHPSRPRS
jgi:glycosyltransferase involved in cell wall biosynthesis